MTWIGYLVITETCRKLAETECGTREREGTVGGLCGEKPKKIREDKDGDKGLWLDNVGQKNHSEWFGSLLCN